MRTSATGIQRASSAQGFTLFELMVVVAIAALFVGMVALSFGGIGGPKPERELRRLADRVALVHDESVLSGRTLGLRPTANGVEFLVLALDPATRRAIWQPVEDDRQLAPLRYAAPYAFTLKVEGAAAPPETGRVTPAVILLPDGDMTPFRATLAATGAPSATLSGAEDGSLRLEAER